MPKVTSAFLKKVHHDPAKVLEEIDVSELVKLLDAASDAYYNTSTPLLADDVFDMAKDILAKRDSSNAFLKKIGAPIRGTKVKLPFWMGSMDKIRDDPKQLAKWKSKYDGKYLVSDKLDGNSAMVVYNTDGSIGMYSRGDGEYGQDISHLVPMIGGIPPPSHVPASGLSVRGELIISRKNWETIKDLGANARNVVAGTMNAKTPNAVIANKIDFVAYEMLKPKSLAPSGSLDALESMGFTVVHRELITSTSLSVESLSDILVRRRKQSPYECDGIIVEHDEIHRVVKGKNPPYAFAFKSILTHEEAEVVVSAIEWNVSKDGYLKPTVMFDPVVIAGAKIQKATGFNGQFIEKNIIGPGARIVIIRSGDVIPHIIRVLAPAANRRPSMPSQAYVWSDNHVDIMITKDTTSKEMDLKRLEHFVSTLAIKNVAAGTLKRLYEAGYTTIPQLFALTRDDVLKIDGFQQASADRIVQGFQSAKTNASCVTLMVASNIFGRGLGQKKIEMFTQEVPSILQGVMPKAEQLYAIKGAGATTVDAFLAGLPDFFRFMEEIGVPCRSKQPSSPKNNTLANSVIVFTGFRNSEWEKMVVELGGKMGTSVTKSTTHVVASDPEDKSTKLQKARDLNIPILSREQFENLLRG